MSLVIRDKRRDLRSVEIKWRKEKRKLRHKGEVSNVNIFIRKILMKQDRLLAL